MTITAAAHPQQLLGKSHPPQDVDLRALGKLVVDSIETYLAALSNEAIPPPDFNPGSTTALPISPAGQEAQRTLLSTVNRIEGLVSGPSGLYEFSRQFLENSALQVAIDLKFAELIPKDSVVSAEQLGHEAHADPVIIVRIMRALTPLFIYEEVEPQCYRHTARSWSMRDSTIHALMDAAGKDFFKVAFYIPQTLKKQGYRNPEDPTDVAFSKAFNTDLGYFSHLYGKEPEMGKLFTEAMAGTVKLSYEVGNVADIYPFDTLANNGGVIVDIGGGKGQVMQCVARRYPEAGLQFVIQDFEANLQQGQASCDKASAHLFTWTPHNFFEEQPVKAAAAYFLRHIMHNWPDKDCVKILKPVVAAMDPKKSRLLIADMVVPDMNAPMLVAHRDLLMMGELAGAERTAKEFEKIFKTVDERLAIHKIWQIPGSRPGGFRIIEVRITDETQESNGYAESNIKGGGVKLPIEYGSGVRTE